MTTSAFDLLTIGHSNHAIDRFVALLADAGVTAVADVRSAPFSRRCPWFSRDALAGRLAREHLAYVHLGEVLGGRPTDPALFAEGVVDYDAIAATANFQAGLARVIEGAQRFRVCLMCAEREPLDCHRCLLVSRALAERRLAIGHILADGKVEPHAETEERLLRLAGEAEDLFTDRATWLERAYRWRARSHAYRAPA